MVYVGQSNNVQARCFIHLKTWAIDRAFFYRVEDKKERNRIELSLIFKHKPKYNVNCGGGFKAEYRKFDKPEYIKKWGKNVKLLTKNERFVLFKRHGLFGNEKQTLQKIGDFLGLTRERIRQIQKMAEFKMSLAIYSEIC